MKPIKRILAPTDFSDGATRSLEYAIHLAQAAEAKLFVLHAYRAPNPSLISTFPETSIYADSLVDRKQIEQEVMNELEELVQDHLTNKNVKYELVSVCDMPEDAIEETVNEKEIDLIVMGTQGGGALDKLLGSTTTHIMRRVACPIIAVPENAIYNKIDRILLATDYERIKLGDTFQILITLTNIFQARIDILHVTPKYTQLTEEKLVVGEALDRMLRHVPHSYFHEENNDILNGLRSFLHDHEAIGMIALIPRDHNLWSRIARGSITKDILFEADRPVFVFHE